MQSWVYWSFEEDKGKGSQVGRVVVDSGRGSTNKRISGSGGGLGVRGGLFSFCVQPSER